MRKNFRVKMDFSRVFLDARQFCWIYVDCKSIFYINQLAEHVHKLFKIKKPFYFISKHEEIHLFLPFEEDVRVLESNDIIILVPGTGIRDDSRLKDDEDSSQKENSFIEPLKNIKTESIISPKKSCTSVTSFVNTTAENFKDKLSLSDDLYTTAVHDTIMYDTRDSKTTDDNLTEDNSIIKENVKTKRKRIRKRKKVNPPIEVVPVNGISCENYSSKKPKVIESVLISSGKHIRFKTVEDEETISDNNVVYNNDINGIHEKRSNSELAKPFINKELNNLLSLRQCSTPKTFSYEKTKKEWTSEIVNGHSKLVIEPHRIKENFQSNKSISTDDTILFKVFRIGEDYTPQLSDPIIAKVISYDGKSAAYVLKIMQGKDQLQEPEGKFSLPKDEENENIEESDIVILEKSKLIELKSISIMGET